jgi:N-acetylmuramoyl-L-alanine amidase
MQFSKPWFPFFITLSAGLVAASFPLGSALAVVFGQKEVDQTKFIAVAKPVGQDSHQLLILEQVTDKKQCWSESGSQPVIVDPLLLKFDFTGICGRSTDANGYSIRMDGQDLGGKYTLRIRYRNNDMVLVGSPDDSKDPEIEIGRANGLVKDFAKIQLNPGWYFSKRTFTTPAKEKEPAKEKVLGHVYLTRDIGDALPFGDVAGDVYLKEIKAAVALKFIAGFQDSTFRPQTPLTREQLVSMVLEALKTLPNIQITVPTAATVANPYPDVDAKRWSAAKIAFARDNKIVTGYQDSTFAPDKPVTRAELLAVLKRAAEYAKTLKKQPTALAPTQAAFAFEDIKGHWAENLITQMSTYCGVASPFNETGNTFAPNEPAFRNYSAAATLRTLNCLKNPLASPPASKSVTPTPTSKPLAPATTPKPVTPLTPKPVVPTPVPTSKPVTPTSVPIPTSKPVVPAPKSVAPTPTPVTTPTPKSVAPTSKPVPPAPTSKPVVPTPKPVVTPPVSKPSIPLK